MSKAKIRIRKLGPFAWTWICPRCHLSVSLITFDGAVDSADYHLGRWHH